MPSFFFLLVTVTIFPYTVMTELLFQYCTLTPFIICYDIFRKFSSAYEWSYSSWLTMTWLLLLLICKWMWHKSRSNMTHLQFFGQNCVAWTSNDSYFLKISWRVRCDFHKSQHVLSQHNHHPIMWKAVQFWDHLQWTFSDLKFWYHW
jgi:hypothetical protein